uniref:YlxR domain-containing protein n=1 Tax=Paulinella micropora TaxID=1928728 RepID=A0A385HZF0_9EUKA|nr:hypothetical protein PMNZ_074 [Paulinella micropora]AXY63037.1 hypothetical protein PMNZ_074 [Paulinella micropora]
MKNENIFRKLKLCVACKQKVFNCKVVRIVRDHDYGIVLDQGMGRSAYLCCQHTCIAEAHYRKRLQHSLRCQIPESIYMILEQRLQCNRYKR